MTTAIDNAAAGGQKSCRKENLKDPVADYHDHDDDADWLR